MRSMEKDNQSQASAPSVADRPSSSDDAVIKHLAKLYADLDAEVKSLTADRDAVRAELVSHMQKAYGENSHTVDAGKYVMNVSYQTRGVKFDGAAFATDHPVLAEQVLTQIVTYEPNEKAMGDAILRDHSLKPLFEKYVNPGTRSVRIAVTERKDADG